MLRCGPHTLRSSVVRLPTSLSVGVGVCCLFRVCCLDGFRVKGGRRLLLRGDVELRDTYGHKVWVGWVLGED
jgi:hypothetical protein